MPHLFLAVTAHGYGHLAQSAPVAEELAKRIAELRITLQGDVDLSFVRDRLPSCSRHIPEATDVGLLMDSPLRTRWDDSLVEYERFESGYAERLQHQVRLFQQDRPDLVLADVPWLPLEAAKTLRIPAAALCSLNWYDILAGSPVAHRLPTAISDHLRAVYGAANMFIRPAPFMPMDWLPNGRNTGPIALRRPNHAWQLRERAGIPADRPLVLMQFGGFDGLDPLRDWPEQNRLHWLVPSFHGRPRADTLSLSDFGLGVLDALGSCDAVLTKPGYGTMAEAACNGKPVLYVSRRDWPEEPALTTWLKRQVPAREISLPDLIAGNVLDPIGELLDAGTISPVPPTGIAEAADLLEPILASG